jgi:phosphoglucosamine mutase
MTKFPQTMVNVRMNKRERLKGNAAIAQAEKAVVDKLRGRGRVLLRPSGTEPVVRVMVEGEDAVFVKTLANELADVVRAEVS